MKKTTYIPLLFLMLLSTVSFAQVQLTRQVVGSTGGDVVGSSMGMSFTVGETVVKTITNSMVLTQGFQQPEAIENLENELVFYTGITPNNDGVNDTWVIDNIEAFPENKVQIFNRWGNEVYYETGYDNLDRVWVGEGNDGALVSATYFYVVTVAGKTYKGWVELTR